MRGDRAIAAVRWPLAIALATLALAFGATVLLQLWASRTRRYEIRLASEAYRCLYTLAPERQYFSAALGFSSARKGP